MVFKMEHNGFTYDVVGDPAELEYVERTPFLQSALKSYEVEEKLIEDLIGMSNPGDLHNVKVKAHEEVIHLARMYRELRDGKARLPKFPRWVSSMHKDRTDLLDTIAYFGKKATSNAEPLVISASKEDILRNAHTRHFYSCLRAGGMYDNVTEGILKLPGIAIAYVDDKKGEMMGRCWVHHATRVSDGADVLVVCQKWGGSVEATTVVDLLRAAGFSAYIGGSYGNQPKDSPDAVKVNFVGCFTKKIHHDMYTWVQDFIVDPY